VDFVPVMAPVDSGVATFALPEFPVRLFEVLPTWRGWFEQAVCRLDTSGRASAVQGWQVRQTEHPEPGTWLPPLPVPYPLASVGSTLSAFLEARRMRFMNTAVRLTDLASFHVGSDDFLFSACHQYFRFPRFC
jgi:hypothetical protein